MSKEQDLARTILQVACCVSLPLEERVEMIKASARALLDEMIKSDQMKKSIQQKMS